MNWKTRLLKIARLKAGDLIVQMREETIKSDFDYHVVWSMIQPGETVKYVVLREGKMLNFCSSPSEKITVSILCYLLPDRIPQCGIEYNPAPT